MEFNASARAHAVVRGLGLGISQGHRLGLLGGGDVAPPQGPSAAPKDAAAPNLNFSNFLCIYIIIIKINNVT